MSATKIALLGYGWIGKALSNRLLENTTNPIHRDPIHISHTDPHHIKTSISPSKIRTFHINLPSTITPSFFKCDVLIITIPFKRQFNPPTLYLNQIKSILPFITGVSQLIFTSSTMIYKPTNSWVNENSPIDNTPRATTLHQVETILQSLPGVKTSILRLGGLFGPGREIGKFVHRKSQIIAHHPVNFIHQKDVIDVMISLIQSPYHGILNVVSNHHPKRHDLYKSILNETTFAAVSFDHRQSTPYKIVDNAKLNQIMQDRSPKYGAGFNPIEPN